MPDDNSGENKDQNPAQKSMESEPVKPPPLPDTPNTQNAQTISQQSMTSEIHGLEDRIRGAEKWMIGLTGGIVLLTLGIVIVGILQWNVMRGQLKEMHDGGTDTHNLAVAAGNQATWTQRLSEQMGHQADWTKQLANDNGSLLRGTQAAFMNFSVSANVLSKTIYFSARNSGKVQAQDLHADLTISVKNWPSHSTRLGPMEHWVKRDRVGNPSEPTGSPVDDQFVIPKITPEIANDLASGAAYIVVESKATYGDGFGNTIHWPNGQTCDAYMYIGHVKCQTGPRSSLDNDIRGNASCAGIDSLRKELEQGMKENQNVCQQYKAN